MRSAILILVAVATLSLSATAQIPFTLTTLTGQVYTPLTGATSFDNDTEWYGGEVYQVTMPFSFNWGTVINNKFTLLAETGAFSDSQNVASGFTATFASLVDRGVLQGTQSLSPIRYLVTGTTPNRIFKAELFNVGFINEYFAYSTLNDSANIQIWIYESGNIAELHYGPSQITYPTDYFTSQGYDLPGYVKNVNFNAQTFNYYYLTGNPSSPTFDSTTDFTNEPTDGITTFPPNGTVYRFTLKGTGVAGTSAMVTGVSVYPTVAKSTIYISNDMAGDATYDLLSVSGDVISKGKALAHGKNVVDLNNIVPGMYIIKVTGDAGQGAYKFVKE